MTIIDTETLTVWIDVLLALAAVSGLLAVTALVLAVRGTRAAVASGPVATSAARVPVLAGAGAGTTRHAA
jgi:hypothetical protein